MLEYGIYPKKEIENIEKRKGSNNDGEKMLF